MSTSRRSMIKAACAASLVAVLPRRGLAQARSPWARSISNYFASLKRDDGGYGFADQPVGHLTPTFAAIACLRLLGLDIPDKPRLAEFIRGHHPLRGRKPERELHLFLYQQVQALAWLGEDTSGFIEDVKKRNRPMPYLPQYERNRYPVMQQELALVWCRKAMNLPMDDAQQFLPFLAERRRDNGSYNHEPARDGADGHVTNTYYALWSLPMLGKPVEKDAALVDWLQSCQRPGGGFTWCPNPEIGAVDDAMYTWAAVLGLRLLGAQPKDRAAAIAYLHSLHNSDGGFADRPGWGSNPHSTQYALEALQALGALDDSPPTPSRPPAAARSLPDNLKLFTIQVEAPGHGSPAEAVDLARHLKIDLWCAKNAPPGWIPRAQAIAGRDNVPVTFCAGDEEYGTFVRLPGLGTYSHISDLFAPAGAPIGKPLGNLTPAPDWKQFEQRRIEPLEKAGGRLFWQFGENEEFARIVLDESIKQNRIYAGISTFHFGNPDFTGTEPFLYKYHGQLPWVGLQDAHGNESWWWGDQLTGFRTFFLATEPTWEGWMRALRENWVAAVRHDAVTSFQTRMHGGNPAVVDFIRQREAQWKWWGDRTLRPPVSLVALRPEDEFDAGRPQQGLALRVRCHWDNTAQGLPKKAVTELVRLLVDGRPAEPQLIQKRNNRNLLQDHYHLHPLPALDPGKHTAEVTVRNIQTGAPSTRRIEFQA